MVNDTKNFLVLFSGTLIASACGLAVLYKGSAAGGLGEECAILDDEEGGGVLKTIVFFFEVMLGSDNQLGCLRESTHPVTAAIVMDSCACCDSNARCRPTSIRLPSVPHTNPSANPLP